MSLSCQSLRYTCLPWEAHFSAPAPRGRGLQVGRWSWEGYAGTQGALRGVGVSEAWLGPRLFPAEAQGQGPGFGRSIPCRRAAATASRLVLGHSPSPRRRAPQPRAPAPARELSPAAGESHQHPKCLGTKASCLSTVPEPCASPAE